MVYIMKGGGNINGGLSKSKKKWGHWTLVETPLVDLIHPFFLSFLNFPKECFRGLFSTFVF